MLLILSNYMSTRFPYFVMSATISAEENDIPFVFTPMCFVGGSCFVLTILFVILYANLCSTRLSYQIMYVLFSSNTRRVPLVGQTLGH